MFSDTELSLTLANMVVGSFVISLSFGLYLFFNESLLTKKKSFPIERKYYLRPFDKKKVLSYLKGKNRNISTVNVKNRVTLNELMIRYICTRNINC